MNNNLLGIKNIIMGIRVDSCVFVSEKRETNVNNMNNLIHEYE
jgi:hypothetical protein